MITEERMKEVFARANPIPDPDDVELHEPDIAPLLEAIRHKDDVADTYRRPHRVKRLRRLMAPVITTAMAMVVMGFLVLLTNETSDVGVADPAATVAVDTAESGAADALVVVGGFFDSFNAGVEGEVLGLLAEDAVVSDSLAGDLGPAEARNWLAWRIAQGSSFGDVECESGGPDGVVVSCTALFQDALGAATNTTAAVVDATFEVGSEEISVVELSYEPTVGEAPAAFVSWLETQYPGDPDAEAAAGVWGDSVEVSRERGVKRAEFAQGWVDFALAAVEETFTAYDNKDLDGFRSGWGEEDTIIGNNRFDDGWFEADFESGPSYSLGSCSPDGMSVGLLVLDCAGTAIDLFGGRSGIVVETDWLFFVDETGIIVSTNDSTDYRSLAEFGTRFQDWMATTHPSVQDGVEWVRPWLAAADDWETVSPYVDEFVEQSDDYPVDR